MRVECQSCGGTYDTIQRDGTEYYHACAPLSVAELRAGLADGSVTLPPGQAKQLAAIQQRGPAVGAGADGPSAEDLFLAQLTIERPNKRDENVRIDRDTKAVSIIAPGAGVLELVDEA